ncbi:hypothetical protein E2K93_06980 [Thalassotalea sp. HSM 43]|uniref:ubiquinone biosynthesis accessory factor UbiJ n=1 Tax=Thalassotalea sp. HSM 43 TaxID=2552945 RepID=UPI001080FFC3|nr:SCP2 sterol-binding domain-containing protein [Thalassotalea sp. HSM 43]QBY04144.1 hypothetical protein E2K93_06980 [Thalassotalea sp. HSM 43]
MNDTEATATLDQLMPKQAVTALLETLANHLLALDNNTAAALDKLENRSLTLLINEVGFPLTFHVSNQHISVIANKLNDDCLIATNLDTLIKLKDLELLTSLIKSGELDIIGDVKVAQQFAAIQENLDIDWQTLLAERIGDVPTHQLTKLLDWLQRKINFAKQQISEDASEYFLHEARLVVTEPEILDFNQQVAELAKQTDTLQQQLNSILAKLTK